MLEFDCETVSAVLEVNYPFVPLKISKAAGYSSCNFCVEIEAVSKQENDKLFVKISNGWCDTELVRMQDALLTHANRNGISVPLFIQTRQGDSCLRTVLEGQKCTFQVFNYLAGTSLIDAFTSGKELCAVAYDAGKQLANFHKATETFTWDHVEQCSRWWGGNGTSFFEKYIEYAEDDRTKYLVEKYLKLCQANLTPRVKQLRKGYIHGDYSDGNILVLSDINMKGERSWKISGMIDFQLSGFHALASDIGVGVAYMILRSCAYLDPDALETARLFVKGYNSVNPITSQEKEAIFEVAVERLFSSYVMGRYLLKGNPEKGDVILLQSKHVPKALEVIDAVGRDAIVQKWFGAL